MRKIVLLVCVLVLSSLPLKADGENAKRISSALDATVGSALDTAVTENFAIYYRFDDTSFDQTYLSNSETAAHIKNYLVNSPRIDSITIYAWASPEGAYHHNVWLSQERAKTAKKFLLSYSPDSLKLNSDKIHISPRAENWPGLIRLVEDNYTRHDREKVLSILRTEGIGDETRKWRLKQLDGGYTWNYLWRQYMPQLRAATWICVWAEVIDPLPEIVQLLSSAATAEMILPEPEIIPIVEKPVFEGTPIAAVRTNLLVPGLNFGAEVPIGNNWSVSADYYFPWFWPEKDNKDCFELLGWSVEGRYWFGKDRRPQDRLRGHSVGLYGSAGYYDFEKNFSGRQGEYISTGFDYTYSMAIGRNKRANLEFTFALGYIRSWGTNYNVPGPNAPLYPEEGRVIFDYFGPTKAAVSVVIPIFSKEGRR